MVREVLIVRPSGCESRARSSSEARTVGQRIGAFLVARDRRPDGIVAAADPWSRRLAEGAAKVMGRSAATVSRAPRVRRRSQATTLGALHVLQGERLLAVGEVTGLDLPIAPLLTVEPTSPQGPRVRDVVSSDELPRTFPFLTAHGVEQRPRPAYYYTQAGGIPYRWGKAGPEILLVTNRKGTKWAIPKGIHEPGYSAEASAAKEAFEEAGVLGEVQGEAVGTFGVHKWGATCTVRVFPLRVTCVLPEEEWEESHRRRRWVRATRAARKVANPGLAHLVARLSLILAAGGP